MKKPSAVIVLLVIVAQVAFPAASRPCGIATSIWGSIEDADVVAVVRIERLGVEDLGQTSSHSWMTLPRKRTVATLRVLDALKGDPPASLDVDLGEDFGLGANPYEEGLVFVAFLEPGTTGAARQRQSQAGYYEVLATMIDEQPEIMEGDPGFPQSLDELDRFRRDSESMYDVYEKWMAQRWHPIDVLMLDSEGGEAEREALTDLIRLAVELQADGSDAAERLDWHVAAAERRATRYQGLLELVYAVLPQRVDPPEIFVSEDEPRESVEELSWVAEQEPPAKLTQEHLKRLAEGFAREQSADYSDLTMLRILAAFPDLEVDRAAAASIEAGLLFRPIPEWVTAMVNELLKRYGDNFEDRIGRDDVDTRGRPIYTGEGENTLPTIWEVARRELGIPQVPPAVGPVRAAASD